MSENDVETKSAKMLTVRLGKDEEDMVKYLKEVHFINISEFVRSTIRQLYDSKNNKAGGVK